MIELMTPLRIFNACAGEGFSVREFFQPPGLHVRRHQHDQTTLFTVISGSVTDGFARRSANLSPGLAVLRPAGEPHTHAYGTTGVHGIAASIESSALDRWERRHACHAISLRAGPHLSLRMLAALRHGDRCSTLTLEEEIVLALDMMAGISTAERALPRWLRLVCDCLNDCPERSVSLRQLAQLAGVHEGHSLARFEEPFAARSETTCATGVSTSPKECSCPAGPLRTPQSRPGSSIRAISRGFFVAGMT